LLIIRALMIQPRRYRDLEQVPNVSEQYEFHVDDEVFHIGVPDGVARALAGATEDAAMIATNDAATFRPDRRPQAESAGREGDRQARPLGRDRRRPAVLRATRPRRRDGGTL
jgi:hypothetical protein